MDTDVAVHHLKAVVAQARTRAAELEDLNMRRRGVCDCTDEALAIDLREAFTYLEQAEAELAYIRGLGH